MPTVKGEMCVCVSGGKDTPGLVSKVIMYESTKM